MDKIINFVGVDMAKNDFYACLNEIDDHRKFNNDTTGIKSFLSHLNKHDFKQDNTVIGVESTASYHLKICLDASDRDYTVKVINPLKDISPSAATKYSELVSTTPLARPCFTTICLKHFSRKKEAKANHIKRR